MPLDILSLAGNALNLAKDLAAQAFEPITLRINPTTSLNIAADSEVTTWEAEVAVAKALQYDFESDRGEERPEGILKNWLVDVADLPAGLDVAKLDQNAEIEDGNAIAWEIYRAEVDPVGASAIFYSRRK